MDITLDISTNKYFKCPIAIVIVDAVLLGAEPADHGQVGLCRDRELGGGDGAAAGRAEGEPAHGRARIQPEVTRVAAAAVP